MDINALTVAFPTPASSAHTATKLAKTAHSLLKPSRLRIKRIYDPAARGDGFRVLVDRLWPRGITKQRAALDSWEKEIAPSTGLRTWFGHVPKRFAKFSRQYRKELKDHGAELTALKRRSKRQTVTLLYAAKSPEYNHARVLQEVIEAL